MKNHILALGVAVLVGLVMVFPQLYFERSLGSQYKGVPMMGADAEAHYLSRMKQFGDGRGTGNPYIKEAQQEPNVLYEPIEGVLALPLRVFPVSVFSLNLFYKTVLPALFFLLVYALSYRLLRDRFWSVATAVLITLGYAFFSVPEFLKLIQGISPTIEFLRYARPVNPQASSLVFMVHLHALLSLFETPTRKWGIIVGILTGISFYVYLYNWTFALALLGVSFGLFCFHKRWVEARVLFYSALLGIVLGIPKILLLISFFENPLRASLPDALTFSGSHAPHISILAVIALSFFYFATRGTRSRSEYFLWSTLITALVVVNQQVLTGMEIQEGHYHWYFNTPIFILGLSYALFVFLRTRPTWSRLEGFGLAFVCVGSFAAAVLIQQASYAYWYPTALDSQRYAEPLEWLENHTTPGGVVFANSEVSELVPLLTRNTVVWAPHAEYYLVADARRAYRPETLLGPDLDFKSRAFQTNYFLWDRIKNPEWKLDQASFLKPLFETDSITLYTR